MTKKVYIKTKKRNVKKIARFVGLSLSLLGFILGIYIFYPLLSWEIYIHPAFANSNFAAPIPHTTIMTKDMISSLFENSLRHGSWLPSLYQNTKVTANITSYLLSIPKLKIENAMVSTIDTDINNHLVNFPATALPPNQGNTVIFGHSTLPQLYDSKNYKTIFANIHNLTVGDKILVTVNNTLYSYSITNISIVDAEDTSYLNQDQGGSFLTIVTCTPPGTTWKRLLVQARLEK